ncbi:MAG TPA: InlB B-repeat-containing protein, partial [Candidatus Nanopelagicaceae bacterium]|nr:InlB B-repeat-containing protein [Candidatus Nanopelagicaceae bacterium]
YAQWVVPPSYTVTFDGSGATGGATASQTTNFPTALTLNGFTRTGYSFAHWNTAANDSGTSYANGATYSFAANLTLFAQWTALPSHTVTFDGNGSTGGSMSAQTANVPTALTSNGFSRTDYVFEHWNTAPDHSGTEYGDGVIYAFNADVTLYAQWAPITHTVTFVGNGSDGGATAPQTTDASSPLTLNGFTRTGYSFAHWNTAANDSGTSYANGATYSFAADLTLFAQWSLITHTVTFLGNSATGGSTAAQTAASSMALTGNGFTRTGYTFAHWNTSADGGGTSYSDGATYSFAADLILYAQWTPVPSHTVTFNGNGSTGGSTAAQTTNVSTALTLNGFTRTGYSFAHWTTFANGSGDTYSDGATYSFAADLTLYAQWTTMPSHTVTFNGNGATGGSMAAQSATEPTTLTSNGFTRTGYTFEHWNTAPDHSGIDYADGAAYSFAADVTLYAHWAALPSHTVTFLGNGSDGGATAPQTGAGSTSLTANGFTRTGYAFNRWNTAANGSGIIYSDGQAYSFGADLTLYARWVALATVTAISPSSGATAGGIAVTITGTNFVATPTVMIGGVVATSVVFVSATSITAVTAAHVAGVVDVVVTNPDDRVSTGAGMFTYVAPVVPKPPTPEPPGAQSAAPIATKDQPVTQVVDSNFDTVMGATIEVSDSSSVVVYVTVPAGATASGVTVSINPEMTPAEAAGGIFILKISATDATGMPVANFDPPLTFNLGRILGGGVAAFSEDGVAWTTIAKLTGSTLPEDLQEGYYVDVNGSFIVLSRHLTFFGIKTPQPLLAIGATDLGAAASVSPLTLQVGNKITVAAFGGLVAYSNSFRSLTPITCSVDQSGVVIGLKVGSCSVVATKDGNGSFLGAISAPLTFSVVEKKLPIIVPPLLPNTGFQRAAGEGGN